MRQFCAPRIESEPPRACPRCGGQATLHARFTRAIHDWEVTFIECARLRCCGGTFTAAPRGVSPGLRYSDRVVALARALVAMNNSFRQCARVLRGAGVVVTAQTVHAWCGAVERRTRARARLASRPNGALCVRLREDLYVALDTRATRQGSALLEMMNFCPSENHHAKVMNF